MVASWVQTSQDTAWRKDILALAENRTPNFDFPFRSLDTVLTDVFHQVLPPPIRKVISLNFDIRNTSLTQGC